jgi:nitric oxide reductase subunit B
MATQDVLTPFYVARLVFGLVFTAGVASYFASFVVANRDDKQVVNVSDELTAQTA